MDAPNEDQIVASSKKRVRRNALKPNSVESDALREFSLLHTLDSKMALERKGEEEQKGETGDLRETAELNGGDVAFDVSSNTREKRQKISDSAQQIERPNPETIETMSVGSHSNPNPDQDTSTQSATRPNDSEATNGTTRDTNVDDADPPIVGDNDSESDEANPAAEREK